MTKKNKKEKEVSIGSLHTTVTINYCVEFEDDDEGVNELKAQELLTHLICNHEDFIEDEDGELEQKTIQDCIDRQLITDEIASMKNRPKAFTDIVKEIDIQILEDEEIKSGMVGNKA